MALIIEFLDMLYGDVLTRCALRGMHEVGKSQLFYALAKDLYDKGRYTNVSWMQATIVIKASRSCSTSCPIQTVRSPTKAPDSLLHGVGWRTSMAPHHR